jgi:hypothetical protein
VRVNEAKDVLVGEIERQASLDGVSLSGLERRMLYFTEEGDCPEDPVALDEGAESENDAKEYEAKISGLARRAHQRLKKENSAGLQLWDEAVRVLKKGDHYLLVMLRMKRPEGAFSFSSFFTTLGLALLLVVVLLVMIIALDHYGIHVPGGSSGRKGIPVSGTHAQVPPWVQRSLLAALVAVYVCGVAYSTINLFFATSSRKIVAMFRRA